MAKRPQDKGDKNSGLKVSFLRYNRYLTSAAFILVIFLSYYFVLAPKYREVGSGGSYNIQTLKQEVEKRKEIISELDELMLIYKRISQSEVMKLENILPKKSDIPGIFVQIEELARENDTFLAGITINEAPGAVRPKFEFEQISKLNITLSLIGNSEDSYGDVKKFLEALERSLRLFDVDAVYFTPGGLEYSVNLVAYYYEPL
ncbi:hypothetical protein HYZ76_00215 [Candidatus Falkowbacteria bacterium]|nr:hypothetical protein [Candidatus Falkowbacteria bacterium]